MVPRGCQSRSACCMMVVAGMCVAQGRVAELHMHGCQGFSQTCENGLAPSFEPGLSLTKAACVIREIV